MVIVVPVFSSIHRARRFSRAGAQAEGSTRLHRLAAPGYGNGGTAAVHIRWGTGREKCGKLSGTRGRRERRPSYHRMLLLFCVTSSFNFSGLFMGRVSFHGTGQFSRIGSGQGDPTRPVKCKNLVTRPVRFRAPPDPLDTARELLTTRRHAAP